MSLHNGIRNTLALMYGLDNIWKGAKNLNIEKIIFKVVQMKFLAMHINNQ